MFKPFRALLFAGLAIAPAGSSHGGALNEASIPGPDRQPSAPMPDDDTLSVMTYNIRGLPWPLATGRDAAMARIADRLRTLRRTGRQPHVIILQEAFTTQAMGIAARAGYAHVAYGPDALLPAAARPRNATDAAYLADARWDRGEAIGKQLGSGLMILSDYPIASVDRMAFPDFACAGFDCLANKGVMIAHLQLPGSRGRVGIVNMHLNARKAAGVPVARSQRGFQRQVQLMAAFVRSSLPAGESIIMGGDLNIGSDAARFAVFFDGLSKAGFGFVRPHLSGARMALQSRATNGITVNSGAAIDAHSRSDLLSTTGHGKDWLFARGADRRALTIAAASVPFGSERDGPPLSDHFGYRIDYRLPAATHPAPRVDFATRQGEGATL